MTGRKYRRHRIGSSGAAFVRKPARCSAPHAHLRGGGLEPRPDGLKEADLAQVAKLVSRALHAVDNETELAEVRREVQRMCDRFPLYASRLAGYERALARA